MAWMCTELYHLFYMRSSQEEVNGYYSIHNIERY
jgi:hypothetical protein